MLKILLTPPCNKCIHLCTKIKMQQFTPKKEKSKTQNMSCKKSNNTLKTHLIVSLSSPHFSVPHPHNSNRNTHIHPGWEEREY